MYEGINKLLLLMVRRKYCIIIIVEYNIRDRWRDVVLAAKILKEL